MCALVGAIVGVRARYDEVDPESKAQSKGSGSEYRGEGKHIRLPDSSHPNLQRVKPEQYCFKQGGGNSLLRPAKLSSLYE